MLICASQPFGLVFRHGLKPSAAGLVFASLQMRDRRWQSTCVNCTLLLCHTWQASCCLHCRMTIPPRSGQKTCRRGMSRRPRSPKRQKSRRRQEQRSRCRRLPTSRRPPLPPPPPPTAWCSRRSGVVPCALVDSLQAEPGTGVP